MSVAVNCILLRHAISSCRPQANAVAKAGKDSTGY